MFGCGNLREDHRAEHGSAAQKLRRGEPLLEQQPAEDQGEHRFQTHENGGLGGLQGLLSQNLEGVGNTHGQNSGIEQGNGTVHNCCERNLFREKHDQRRQQCADQTLNAVKADTVQLKPQSVHNGDLHGEPKSAANQKNVAQIDLGNTRTAEQI